MAKAPSSHQAELARLQAPKKIQLVLSFRRDQEHIQEEELSCLEGGQGVLNRSTRAQKWVVSASILCGGDVEDEEVTQAALVFPAWLPEWQAGCLTIVVRDSYENRPPSAFTVHPTTRDYPLGSCYFHRRQRHERGGCRVQLRAVGPERGLYFPYFGGGPCCAGADGTDARGEMGYCGDTGRG